MTTCAVPGWTLYDHRCVLPPLIHPVVGSSVLSTEPSGHRRETSQTPSAKTTPEGTTLFSLMYLSSVQHDFCRMIYVRKCGTPQVLVTITTRTRSVLFENHFAIRNSVSILLPRPFALEQFAPSQRTNLWLIQQTTVRSSFSLESRRSIATLTTCTPSSRKDWQRWREFK